MGATVDDIIRGIFKRDWSLAGLIDVVDMLLKVIQLLLLLGGAAATFFIIRSGFEYLTAFGDEQKATKGKNGLTAAIVGVVIMILAFWIVHYVNFNLINATMEPPEIKNPPIMN